MDSHAGLFPVLRWACGSPTRPLFCSWEHTLQNSESSGPPALEVFCVKAVSKLATISSRCLAASKKCSLHTGATMGLLSWPLYVRRWEMFPHPITKALLSARWKYPCGTEWRPCNPHITPARGPDNGRVKSPETHPVLSYMEEMWLFLTVTFTSHLMVFFF